MKSSPNYITNTIGLFGIASILFLLYTQLFHKEKIVYVDSTRILNEYKGAEKARKELETKAKTWQHNVDTLTLSIQNSIKSYEMKVQRMSLKEQNQEKHVINLKRKELSDYQRAIQENAAKENAKLMSPVISRVNKFLADYGKDKGYTMILIANQSGTIAYAKEGLDVTSEVIKELNKEFSGNIK